MRLKKLIVQGFKSFADRTEFVFDSPITGIVGPNGCGKSNVVDAFKWVLGEQSAKSLRGEAMLDVIFNGSSSRKPSGLSEVVLVFENPKRADDTRALALDLDEVAVGRRLFRDGTSEYQVNNNPSRLKDVRELFLDTGIGVDAYSVIEQGRVAALLDSNPDERRAIFEEAAGISKYKVKKKEAQRKLEKVDQNLLRLNDTVEEVDRRLRSVKVAAGKARNYQEYANRLNDLRLSYALQEYHINYTKLTDLDKQREDAQFRLDDLGGDLAKQQNDLATKRQDVEALSESRQRYEYELVQARAAVQSAQQRQSYAQQQLGQIAEQLATCEHDRAELAAKLAAVTQSLEIETQNLVALTQAVNEHRQQIEQKQQQFRDLQLQLNQAAQDVERNKQAVIDLMRKLAQVNSRLGAIEIERRNIANQQTRLADRRRVVLAEAEQLDAQRVELKEKLQTVLNQQAAQQGQLEEKKIEAQQWGKQIADISQMLGAAREHRSGLISRQKLLKDLEAKREGVSEGVKSVLRQREQKFNFIRGLVADLLSVDVEHAHVIEAALDGRDQWLVADSQEAVQAAQATLAVLEGRVNIICADRVDSGAVSPLVVALPQGLLSIESPGMDLEPQHRNDPRVYDWNQHEQEIRLAIDLVRFGEAEAPLVRHLLGKTVVVDCLADAIALHRAGPGGWRYVTRQGEVIERDGTLRAGPLTAAMGLLSRRSELEALDQQIAEVDRRIQLLSGQLTEGNATARALEEDQNTLRNGIYQLNAQKVELTSKAAQIDDKIISLRREQPVLDRELASLLDQVGRLKGEESKLTESRATMDADQAERQKKIEELTSAQAHISDEVKHLGESLTNARVLLGQVQEKQLACQQEVQRQTGARAEFGQQIERLERTAATIAAKRIGIERELESARHAEASLEEKQKSLAGQIESIAAKLTDAAGMAQQLQSAVDRLRGEHAETEQELHALELRVSELRVRLEGLVQRATDEMQVDLPAKYAEAFEAREMDWDAVAAEIKELREKIQRLGNVNLDAISELQELEQKQAFYATQLADLASGKQQLEAMIEEINRESSIRFEQTFNTVREHFQAMFRKLFGGGKADIILEIEPEEQAPSSDALAQLPDGQLMAEGQTLAPKKKKRDILDAGVEIIARPPGKQPATISQLSGGEKAMTCIALLMSIFKSKPSPFCILDEVDAPLDEANNQRFGLIIQEFLAMSQFIIITHHKRTMQICDVLYGVTMQEQGVSKRVAVRFDQVGNNGQISQAAVKTPEPAEIVAA